MSETRIEQQVHGYLKGHQLLSGSTRLSMADQDTVDQLSDMAGSLRPGETFAPYLTTYPLPSRRYYVVARTWQDLAASRAGCVLTRSLLVPMGIWEAQEGIAALLPLLTQVDRNERVRSALLPVGKRTVRQVTDPRMVELLEAIFLEQRQPIVIFEAEGAEDIVARLLMALWPSLKRNFATCTFALAARTIQGRDFDLLFAPRSAQSRFANWTGRRIDAGRHRQARHRWSTQLASKVFESDRPSLADFDTLGILAGDTQGDESSIRLALLWNELTAKAQTTPTAVLGMIDVLNSRSDQLLGAIERIEPLVSRAIGLATTELPTADAWQFLSALVGKMPGGVLPVSIRREVEQASALLSAKNPTAAYDFLQGEAGAITTIPSMLLVGLGEGLCSADGISVSRRRMGRLAPDLAAGLLAASPRFAHEILASAKREPTLWVKLLTSILEATTVELMPSLRRVLVPLLNEPRLTVILPSLLRGIDSQDLASVALEIGRQTNFEVTEFYAPLLDAARTANSLNQLRNAVAKNFDGLGAEDFLLSTLRLDGLDVAWILNSPLGERRARELLVRLLASSSDRSVQAVQRNAATRSQILNCLKGNLSMSATQIARILTLGDSPIGEFLEVGQTLLADLEYEDAERLAIQMLERGLAEARASDASIFELLVLIGTKIDGRRLVRLATPLAAPQDRLGANLVAINALPLSAKLRVLNHIEELTERLVYRRPANLSERAYEAWGAMICESGVDNSAGQRLAAVQALDFSLAHLQAPLSALIVASLPVVNAYLQNSRAQGDQSFLGVLLSLPLAMLGEYDRTKGLHRAVVNAFMRSEWPPADLLLAGLAAGIEQKLLKKVAGEREGGTYLRKMRLDIARLPNADRMRARAALNQFMTRNKRSSKR